MGKTKGCSEVHRRKFLKTGMRAGLGAAMLGASALQAPAREPVKKITPGDSIPAREFGKTGHRLPVLAYGGSAMVEKWAQAYGPQLPFDQRVTMVRHAYEAGVRYFDTSRNYGESESILGEALRDVRDNIYLATKVGVKASDDGLLGPGQIRTSLEESLKTLKTDYVDCAQLHGPVFEYMGHDAAMRIYEELAKLRDEKLTRFIGVTGHNDFKTMYRLIDTGAFDQALIAYGYFPKGMDTILSHANLQWREMCLNRAQELGMGVLAMKTMGSFVFGYRAGSLVPGFGQARLAALRQAALRWVLSDGRVALLLVGVSRPAEIDQNVRTLQGDLTLTAQDRKVLAEFSVRALQSEAIKAMKVT